GARQLLGRIDPTTRRDQLCGIEAVEQVRAHMPGSKPGGVVAHAFGDPEMHDNVLTAEGAAVQIGSDWLEMRFECTLAADGAGVVDFAFSVGAVIPETEWDRHGLGYADIDRE